MMKKRGICLILTLLMAFSTFIIINGITSDDAFAASNSESGSVVVIIGDGTVSDYTNRFRDAWEFCDEHYGCTMKLTSDLKLDKQMSTGGRLMIDTKINVDLNGHVIDCQNNCRAFNVFRNGTLKVFDSSSSKTGKIINGNENNGGAIRTSGVLELEDITIEKCKSDSSLTGGGAIYVWTVETSYFKISDPHVVINNCIIKDCSADTGGAIECKTDTIKKITLTDKNNPVSGEAVLEAAREQENDESEGGDAVLISNSTIQNCDSVNGGAIRVHGAVTVDNCKIFNCDGGYAGGGVSIEYGSSLKMFNSIVSGCRATGAGGGKGGGIYLKPSAMGDAGGDASKAEIWGGQITNNTSDEGSGIYFPTGNNGDGILTIGGELIVKDNRNTKGKLDNIEFESTPITFYKEGIYGKADVGTGTDESSDEAKAGNTASYAIAKETVKHIKADHMKDVYNEDFGGVERLGAYTKNTEASVYIGPSRKIEIINFELLGEGRSQYKAEINRKTKEITVRFPFSEGLQPGGVANEPFRVTWDSGYGGTIFMHGEGMKEAVSDKPFNYALTTYHSQKTIDKTIVISCGGAEEVWTVRFVNEGETRCTISVTNGHIPNFLPDREYGDTKQYQIPIGREIKIVADAPDEGQCFDYWGYVNRGIEPRYDFQDFYSSTATVIAPASKGRKAGLVFKACYRDIASVNVINGTHTDGSAEKDFKPGEHVKVIADTSMKNFDHWEVVKGKLTLSKAQAKSRVLEFDMGYTDVENPKSGRYGDITLKAAAISVQGKGYKNSIKYSWNPVIGATTYRVYLAKYDKKYKKVKTTSATTFTKKKLNRNKTYKAYVVAYNAEGQPVAKTSVIRVKTKR